MCTVVFIPGETKKNFASLRDESPLRQKASVPLITKSECKILSPVDPFGGGTWIGANEYGNIIVLLNGAFQKHERNKQFSKSRGLIVTELLSSQVPVIEWSLMELENIEPFTLIVWSFSNLFQLVWDGEKKHRIKLDESQPCLWSSSTLYDDHAKLQRKELFLNWIDMNPPVNELSLMEFFKTFTDNKNGYLMNRNEQVKTLSYSFIELHDHGQMIMNYSDLSDGNYHQSELQLVGGTEFYDLIKASEHNS